MCLYLAKIQAYYARKELIFVFFYGRMHQRGLTLSRGLSVFYLLHR